MKIAFETLGCRTNFLDSSSIAQDFLEAGWDIVHADEIADVYVINSCTVTHKGDADSRSAVNRLKRKNNQAKIIMTGCYAQVAPDECSTIDGVHIVAGNLEKHDLIKLLQKPSFFNPEDESIQRKAEVFVQDIMQEKDFYHKPIYSALGRTRANLKVQDGCNYRCSFCIIPYARGNSRSNSLDNILIQAQNLIQSGYQEITLTGIHLGQYGYDLKSSTDLSILLQEIEKIEGLSRYRLSSIGPMEITDKLIETVAQSKKFCKHLHISLQSGNNDILKAMRRPYTVEKYVDIIEKISTSIDDIAIGSDIIVGFPGETDKHFLDTYHMIETLPITYVHAFTYSERQGTKASLLPEKISTTIKKDRHKQLTQMANEKKLNFYQRFLHRPLNVLVENTRDKKTGLLKGLTDNYIKVLFEGEDSLLNTIVPVKITNVSYNSVKGEISK